MKKLVPNKPCKHLGLHLDRSLRFREHNDYVAIKTENILWTDVPRASFVLRMSLDVLRYFRQVGHSLWTT